MNKLVFRGEIYLTSKFPVVIIQNNIGNAHSPNVIVASISTKRAKSLLPTHLKVELKEESIIKCESIHTISKEELLSKVGELTSAEIISLDDKIAKSLGLKWIS